MRGVLVGLVALVMLGAVVVSTGETCCWTTSGAEFVTVRPVRRAAVTGTPAPPRVVAVRWRPMALELDTLAALSRVGGGCPPIARLEVDLAPEDAVREVGYVLRGVRRVDESPSYFRPVPAAARLTFRVHLSELMFRTTPIALTLQAVDRSGAVGPPSEAIVAPPLPRVRAVSSTAAWTSFALALPLLALFVLGRRP